MKNSVPAEIAELEGFTNVCPFESLKEKTGKRFLVDDVEIAVFRIESEVYALSNICPHQHTALICDGFIEDGCVVCPAHGWMFNLQTGRLPSGSRGVDSYPVKIINGNVFIKVFKKDFNW